MNKRLQNEIWQDDFDVTLWRELLGEYVTRFLFELRNAIGYENISLAVGIPRGNILGPPLGNTVLQWSKWVRPKEKTLLLQPGVQGLVFSSFRHDNPAAIRRNDWTA